MPKAKIELVNSNGFIGFRITGTKLEAKRQQRQRLRTRLDSNSEVQLPQGLPVAHRLYGSVLKLRVANTEIEQLNRQIKAVVESKRNTIRYDRETDSAKTFIRLVIKKRPDPTWGVKAGEIAHNLRSVLDTAVTQLSVGRKGRTAKPEFPIFVRHISKQKARGGGPVAQFIRGGKRHIACLPLPYQILIERAQPYHAGNLRWQHPLWLLHRLNNDDKHNILTVTTTAVSSAQYQLPTNLPAYMADPFVIKAGVPFEDGEILAEASGDVQFKPRYGVVARFGHGCSAVKGKAVIDTLRSIEKEVRKIIVGLVTLEEKNGS